MTGSRPRAKIDADDQRKVSPHEVTLDPDNPEHEVKERVTAKHSSPISGGMPVTLTGVDEILVADGRVLYQCAYVEGCSRTFDNSGSARGHMSHHSSTRELREKAAELDRIRAQRSAASRKGRATRAAGKTGNRGARAAVTVVDEVTSPPLNDADVESLPPEEIALRLGGEPNEFQRRFIEALTRFAKLEERHVVERREAVDELYAIAGQIEASLDNEEDASKWRRYEALMRELQQ